jgi:Flp pilus assembly protein TadB
MLAEPDASSGANINWRSLVGMIGLAALFVGAILILHPPLLVVLALEVGLMAYCAWREMARKPAPLELGLAVAA